MCQGYDDLDLLQALLLNHFYPNSRRAFPPSFNWILGISRS